MWKAGETVNESALPAALAAAMPDASVFVFDRELRFTAAEGAPLERAGWRPENIVGRSAADVLPRASFEILGPCYLSALAGHNATVELRGERDGVVHRVTAVPIRDDTGAVVGGAAVARSRGGSGDPHFDAVFEQGPLGIALVSLEGRCVRANPALGRLLGARPEDLLGRGFAEVAHPDDLAAGLEAGQALLAGTAEATRTERRLFDARGRIVHVVEHMTLVRSPGGEPRHFVVQVEDRSHACRMEHQLKEVQERDPLTGLPNRPWFDRELTRRMSGDAAPGPAALLLLDLDHFKYVNDAYGHRIGDDLLRMVVGTVRAALPHGSATARLGGDELAVLLEGVGPEAAEAAAADLVRAIRARRLPVGGDQLYTTASVGVVPLDAEAGDAEAVLVAADLAMYEAKASGGDRAVTHDPTAGARERASRGMHWSQRIRGALELERLELHAQPVIDMGTGRPVKYELLVRMREADGALVAPGHFLPHAERFGLVTAIDRWVVGRAVALVAEHDVALSLNLSGRSIGDTSLPAYIEDAVTGAGIDPTRLCFEVTETAAIAHMDHAQRLAGRLRGLGCEFSLDDFGAGFASFTYVKQIPFDVLKIDGSFVRDLATSAADRLVVRALVEVARGLGKQTVAEFVWDQDVLEEVRECGVDLAQGFHLGVPAPLEAWLASAGG